MRCLETLKKFRTRGIQTQATVSPLLPLADPQAFAHRLDTACDRVIIDHYLIGDGFPNGWRTKRTTFAQRLEQRLGSVPGTLLTKLWEIRDVLAGVLGAERVLVGCDGFNSVSIRRGIARSAPSQQSFSTTSGEPFCQNENRSHAKSLAHARPPVKSSSHP